MGEEDEDFHEHLEDRAKPDGSKAPIRPASPLMPSFFFFTKLFADGGEPRVKVGLDRRHPHGWSNVVRIELFGEMTAPAEIGKVQSWDVIGVGREQRNQYAIFPIAGAMAK